jgi:hypothetical protein
MAAREWFSSALAPEIFQPALSHALLGQTRQELNFLSYDTAAQLLFSVNAVK